MNPARQYPHCGRWPLHSKIPHGRPEVPSTRHHNAVSASNDLHAAVLFATLFCLVAGQRIGFAPTFGRNRHVG